MIPLLIIIATVVASYYIIKRGVEQERIASKARFKAKVQTGEISPESARFLAAAGYL